MNATEPFKQGDFSIICRTRARRFNAAQVRVSTILQGDIYIIATLYRVLLSNCDEVKLWIEQVIS